MAKRDLDEIVTINSNGTTYNVNKNAIGAKELNITTPDLVVRGKKKQPYRSSFDPTAAWDVPHAALETLGKGMSYITPDWMAAAAPYLSPSQYIGMFEGKGLPGSKTNDGFGSNKQGQYLNEMFDLATSKIPIAKAALKTGKWSYGVAKNIKNRNQHAYATIAPWGYEEPFTRFKSYAKSILSGEPVYDHLGNMKYKIDEPNYISESFGPNKTRATVESISRDEAWRKYLGLPSALELKGKAPIYLDNLDGSVRYNIDHLQHLAKKNNGKITASVLNYDRPYVTHDWLTGNGGNVSQHSKILDYKIHNNTPVAYGVGKMSDVWDLHPFKNINEKSISYINGAANHLYTTLYPKLYKNRKAYKYLGGKYLNKLRYGDASIPGILKTTKYEQKLNPKLNKLLTKLGNIEIGNIVGGKPFSLEQPFTFMSTLDKNNRLNSVLGWEFDNNNPFGTLETELNGVSGNVLYDRLYR